MPWDDFLALGAKVDDGRLKSAKAACDWRQPVVLQYTSGTTAFPKGALCNHRYVLNCGTETFLKMGALPGEPLFSTQPFYHIGGSCSTVPLPLNLGGAMVIPEFYDAERVLQLIERERCVARTGFGTMYVMEMNLPNFASFDLRSLRAGWCIATPALMNLIRDRFDMPDLIPLYAATEVGGTVGSKDDPWEERSTTCGRPLSGAEMRIADENDRPRPNGAHGEIQMRSWWQMSSYLNQPEATESAVTPDGWIRTGDLGWIDDRGCLHFAGRIKEMMKIGGENVSAEEVENLLMQLPAVKQVAAFGVPDERLVEVVAVAVELRAGTQATAEEIITYCKARLANFRVPRHVRFVTEWPMTGSGKIQKRLLKEAFAAEVTPTSQAPR
ncbi:MAG: fatty acid--CoA ligase family protein [Pseudomonadota bacterium]|nr:fatty acid--CoA ligase family protein [Pseudomonadota bacterium]